MVVEKLVKLTYNKIFFEDLHILQSDIDSIKRLILNNHKLLKKKLDKVFFISDLAEMIKNEKIDECLKQKREKGMILMSNYKEIFTLYNWLVNSDFKNDGKLNIRDVILYKWEIEDEKLILLFEELKDNFISLETSLNAFKFLFSGKILKNVDEKIEWLKVAKNSLANKKSITDLIDILHSLEIISKSEDIKQVDENKILSTFFSSRKGELKFANSNFTKLGHTSEHRIELETIIKSII